MKTRSKLSDTFKSLKSTKTGAVESFGFGFITPEDVAKELIEAEEKEKGLGKGDGDDPSKTSKSKKKKSKKKKMIVTEGAIEATPIVMEKKATSSTADGSEDEGDASNEDELVEAMTLLQQKDDQNITSAALAKQKTPEINIQKIENTTGVEEPPMAPDGVKKKTRRGKRSKAKKKKPEGDKKEDSDDDWYDPQPQPTPQPAVKVTGGGNGGTRSGGQKAGDSSSSSSSKVRFVSGASAKAAGRNLVAQGPVKVRNSAWAKEPKQQPELREEKARPTAMPSVDLSAAAADSPFSFGFQLSI